MRNKLLVGVTLLISVADRLYGQAVVALLPPPMVTLTWEYPISSPDIVFNVYHTTNLAVPKSSWTLVTNVAETRCSFIMQPGTHFFTVTASNRATGLESLR